MATSDYKYKGTDIADLAATTHSNLKSSLTFSLSTYDYNNGTNKAKTFVKSDCNPGIYG